MIDKGVCDKGFIWDPSNCECECYKFCNFSEYLEYKNCKCKKRSVDKLVECSSAEEYAENIDEKRLIEINSSECNSVENKCKHNSCTLYIALFLIIFTANIGIGSYFLCFYCNLKKDLICVKFGTRTQTTI